MLKFNADDFKWQTKRNALGHNGDGSQLYVTGTTYVFITILRQHNALGHNGDGSQLYVTGTT